VPLYGAAGINGDAELTRSLLEAGADPNDEGEREIGEALYHACEFDDPTAAALLIQAGTHHHVVDYCLGRALNFDNHEMVRAFCAHGARASAAHLHQAVWRRRSPDTLAVLLDAGAPIDEPDEHGLTALQVAVRWDDTGSAGLLADRGADPQRVGELDRRLGAWMSRSSDEPPDAPELDEMLILSVQGGRLDAVRRLLDAGARVDGDPETKDDPLGQACWRGQVEIAGELIGRGASLTFMDGGTAIGAALHGSRHCHVSDGGPTMRTIEEIDRDRYARTVRLLLDAGAPVPEQMAGRAERPRKLLSELGIELPPAAAR
jgi:ankyrin repeat protein